MQYRLKKDLPWAKAGSLWEDTGFSGGAHEMRIINIEDFNGPCALPFRSNVFSDWFEEVDERWKPKLGVMYCYIDRQGELNSLLWGNHFDDEKRYEFGNCFRTPELAKEASEQIKALLKEFHKNNP